MAVRMARKQRSKGLTRRKKGRTIKITEKISMALRAMCAPIPNSGYGTVGNFVCGGAVAHVSH
jgi:hypothetical protein